MPRRFRNGSLDALLAELAARGKRPAWLPLAVIERDVRRAERILSLTSRASDTCLYRALARYATLTRAGLPAVFLMGLPRCGGEQPGHAWVEICGKPFAETASVANLAVTYRFPPVGDATKP